MSRHRTWKEMQIRDGREISRLYSYSQSNLGAWSDYTIEFDFGNGFLLTDMPWAELRRWFSFVGIPFPKDYLTSSEHPYPECGEC